MKKKYINPEIKTIELLSNTMMLSISTERYASEDDALSTGRRDDRVDDWTDPWN